MRFYCLVESLFNKYKGSKGSTRFLFFLFSSIFIGNMKALPEKEAISILEEHDDWRYAVSTSGYVAHKPCFVATTVPTVHKVDADVQLAYFLTKSQWTDQLMITGVGNDVTSLRSLSLCNTLAFSNLGHMEYPRKVHQVQSQSEYIVSVSSIARLDPEFEACLDEAKSFWSKGHYDVAWGRLQLIWYTYGFLWPEEVHIGKKKIIERI